MASGGDIVQAVHRMDFGTNAILNVYYLEAAVAGADLADITDYWVNTVVPAIQPLQPVNYSQTEIVVQNLFDDSEREELALTGAGTRVATSAEVMPSFVALTCRYPHDNGAIRDGYKRFAVGDEEDQSGNSWAGAFVTEATPFAELFTNPPDAAIGDWAWVIVNRIPVTDPVTGEVTYRLPETQAEAIVGYPTSVEVVTLVRSQVSRKAGVGI